jgi:hypothetical protein
VTITPEVADRDPLAGAAGVVIVTETGRGTGHRIIRAAVEAEVAAEQDRRITGALQAEM